MNTTAVNGHGPRKSLAAQLDRLDGIIDTLAEGLTGAVADAVRDAVTAAVRQAVEQVLREVLGNPVLLRSLAVQLAPPVPAVASIAQAEPGAVQSITTGVKCKVALGIGWRWLRHRAKTVCHWAVAKARRWPGKVRDGLHRIGLLEKLRALRHAWQWRGTVSLSVAAGILTGVLGYLAGPAVSAVALGTSGAALTLSAVLVAPLIRLSKALQAHA